MGRFQPSDDGRGCCVSVCRQLSTPTEEERRSFCHRLSHHATGSMGSAWAEKEWSERAMYAFVRAPLPPWHVPVFILGPESALKKSRVRAS